MGAVFAEPRPAEYLPLPTRHGRARIDRIAAAGVLRYAADQMSQLHVRSCQIEISAPSGAPTPDADGSRAAGAPSARVHISVTVRFGADLLSATTRVRQIILAAAEDLLGLPVAAVDVDVVDVFEDLPGAPTDRAP